MLACARRHSAQPGQPVRRADREWQVLRVGPFLQCSPLAPRAAALAERVPHIPTRHLTSTPGLEMIGCIPGRRGLRALPLIRLPLSRHKESPTMADAINPLCPECEVPVPDETLDRRHFIRLLGGAAATGTVILGATGSTLAAPAEKKPVEKEST